MRVGRVVTSLSMSYLLMGQVCFGWWPESHRIIASIAELRLNSRATAAVAAILPPGQSLESIAPWADEIRIEGKKTGRWHYINIPTGAVRGAWSRYCPEDACIAAVIPKMEAVLRDESATRKRRAEALRFLVHLMGDLHQPLHAGERQDRGGNLVRVHFDGQAVSLHAAWDGKMIEAWFRQDPNADRNLRMGAPANERAAMTEGSLDDWLWESQEVARDAVYAPLDRCHCRTLNHAYLEQSIPVLREQLLRAGERLGRVLNETLGR